MELYNEIYANVSDPHTRFVAIIAMLKSEGHTYEATNIQESLRGKVNNPNIVNLVIKVLSSMNERSRAEQAKEAQNFLIQEYHLFIMFWSKNLQMKTRNSYGEYIDSMAIGTETKWQK